MHILPLGGCDLVLGAQWLKTLGPVTFDYEKLNFSYKSGDEVVLMQGRGSSSYSQNDHCRGIE